MLRSIRRPTLFIACSLALWASPNTCRAHFLWIKTITNEGRPHAFLFFGEDALDEAYNLPESLTDSKAWLRTADGERRELSLSEWEGEDRIGLGARLDDGSCVLEASEQYGVYGTALLVYSAKHVHARSSDEFNKAGSSTELALDIVPRVNGKQLELTVLWDGKRLAEAEISVAVADAEAIKKTTDENGQVAFTPKGAGIVSVLANRMDKTLKGKLNDKPYDHGLHYVSLTFDWPVQSKPSADDSVVRESPDPAPIVRRSSDPARVAALPPLPQPLSSFGAVVADNLLYVYGGHTGTEHEHSAENLSKHFRRMRLAGYGDDIHKWDELPMQTPLQGLALVAYGGKIYRIGGMNAQCNA